MIEDVYVQQVKNESNFSFYGIEGVKWKVNVLID